jgi:regulator of sigma E protease
MSWILAFAGFAVLIVLHEFGHFIAAKKTGMRVERFFLFFPPKIWSFKRGETEYGVGWIPLGGFVKITGMNPDELREGQPDAAEQDDATPAGLLNKVEAAGQEEPFEPLPPDVIARGYYNQPVWKRITVIAAGPAMNILIAFVIFFGLAFGIKEATGPGLEVAAVSSGFPAEGQLEENDRIVSIDGQASDDLEASDRAEVFREQIGTHTCAGTPEAGCTASEPVEIVVERDGKEVPLSITPEFDEGADQPLLGVQFAPTDFESINPSVPEAANLAVDQMWFITRETFGIFARILDPEKRKEISGVVGSYETTRQAIEFDTRTALVVLGLISLSVAIINLFPFLPLDGGHIFWSLVEKVRGRPVSFRTMEKAGAVGFVLIMLLFFIGLQNDIGRLSGEGFDIGGR